VSRESLVPIFIAALLIAGCMRQVVVDVEAEKAEVASVLDSYVTSVESEDMTLYAENIAHDSTMINFGALGEPIVGWTALQGVMNGQNDALSDIQIDVSDQIVHMASDGRTAWATSLWTFRGKTAEGPMELPVRCTWILEKRTSGWTVVHFHKSVAAG